MCALALLLTTFINCVFFPKNGRLRMFLAFSRLIYHLALMPTAFYNPHIFASSSSLTLFQIYHTNMRAALQTAAAVRKEKLWLPISAFGRNLHMLRQNALAL